MAKRITWAVIVAVVIGTGHQARAPRVETKPIATEVAK